MKHLPIALCILVLGCQTAVKPPSPPEHPKTVPTTQSPYGSPKPYADKIPLCPYIMPGARYIPEAATWLDYSEDPLSYHYHGRNRDISNEELTLYKAEVLLNSSPDNPELQGMVVTLRQQYKPLLDELAKQDEITYNATVKITIAEAKAAASSNGRLSGK